MLKNFFKTAFRQFVKNKWYSTIHVFGLTVGLAVSLVILLLVKYEYSFDRGWKDADRIYRVSSKFSGLYDATNRGIVGPAAEAIRADFPLFSSVAPIHTYGAVVNLPNDADNRFLDNDFGLVDTGFFEIFSDWQWKYGRGPEAMSAPHAVVLSSEAATKYFGEVDASVVGREIIMHDSLTLTVAGIFDPPPWNTDFRFDGFISYPTIFASWLRDDIELDSWNSTTSSSLVFVKTAAGVSQQDAQVSLARLEERKQAEDPESKSTTNFILQPLTDIHFNTKYGRFNFSGSQMEKSSLLALAMIGILLLVLACFNFINLETAKSALRAREIGVRKVMGSSRKGLILQFLGETAVITGFAALVAVPVVQWMLPFLEDYLPEYFHIDWLSLPVIISVIALIVVVTVASGLYPASIIAGVNPTDSMRSGSRTGTGGRRSVVIRKSLIAVQFFVTQILLIGALIVWKQTDFAISKDLGFSQEAIIDFALPWHGSKEQKQRFQHQVEQHAAVELSSRFQNPPAFNGYSTNTLSYEKEGEEYDLNVHQKRGDSSFLHLFDIEIIAGRLYREHDSIREYMVNEHFAHQMGFQQAADAVGTTVSSGTKTCPIVGVVRDFHVQSLHEPMVPVAISFSERGGLGVKISTARWQDVDEFLSEIEPLWKEIWPRSEFNYAFMDETIAKLYESEVKSAKLLTGGTAIALFISGLGLLGLVAFLAHQRTKEIGIRKVLGATVGDIVTLLSWDFLKWILIALIPASVVGYLIMQKWLNEFAYRLDFIGGIILLAAIGSIAIAASAVMLQGYRAAQSDPVDSLRLD